MLTHITVPLPENIRHHLNTLADENFNLWLFIAQNDLLEEARDSLFLTDTDWRDFENIPF